MRRVAEVWARRGRSYCTGNALFQTYLGASKTSDGGPAAVAAIPHAPALPPARAGKPRRPGYDGGSDARMAQQLRARFGKRTQPGMAVTKDHYTLLMAEWKRGLKARGGVLVYEEMLRMLGHQGKHTEAWRVVKAWVARAAAEGATGEAAKPTLRMCVHLLCSCIAAAQTDKKKGARAARLYLIQQGYELTLRHYWYLFSVYAQRLRLWRRGRVDPPWGSAAKCGRTAVYLLETMVEQDGVRPNAFCWEVLIKSRASYEEALAMMNQMAATGTVPTDHTYCAVLTVCGHLGDARSAEKVVAMLHREGLRSNAYVYALLMRAYIKEGSHASRVKVFQAWQHVVARAEDGATDLVDAAVATLVVSASNPANPTPQDLLRAKGAVGVCLRYGKTDTSLFHAYFQLLSKTEALRDLRWLAGECATRGVAVPTLLAMQRLTRDYTVWAPFPPSTVNFVAREREELASTADLIDSRFAEREIPPPPKRALRSGGGGLIADAMTPKGGPARREEVVGTPAPTPAAAASNRGRPRAAGPPKPGWL